jgi:polyhydroxybutyrate depolymerase
LRSAARNECLDEPCLIVAGEKTMLALQRSHALTVIILAILFLAACARVEQRVPTHNAAGDSVESLAVAGVTRQYRLHIPPIYQQGRLAPLVINLHGYNSNAEQQEQLSRMSVKADSAGFIVVYPEGLGDPQSWKFGDRAEGQADVAFIHDLIQHLQGQFSVDPRRIYVTGISNGAEMSYRLACDLAATIAAFAPVAGGYPPFTDCKAPRPVPVIAFHGTDDQLLPYEGKPPLLMPVHDWAASWAARNSCAAASTVSFQQGDVTEETWGGCRDGADVALYTISGKGHSWPGSSMPARITTHDINATDVIWEFFAAHPKP